MLKSKQMCRVTIAGPKTVMEPTIEALYELNLMHITDYMKEYEDFDIGAPLEKSGKISEVLVRMRSVKSHLSSINGTKDGQGRKKHLPVKRKKVQSKTAGRAS